MIPKKKSSQVVQLEKKGGQIHAHISSTPLCEDLKSPDIAKELGE